MTSEEAKTILEGIAGLASRIAKSDPAHLRVKPGGETNRGNATIDWYLTVQNMPSRKPGDADPAINTSAARTGGLCRQLFRIVQWTGQQAPGLSISEWNAEDDWLLPYREVWTADVTLQSRQEMAKKLADTITSFAS